ncbi:MAG: class I SAM-dependent methyltransferase [Bdellovibrio sp.]
MKFKKNFFQNYIVTTPLPLALERCWECEIQSNQKFLRPILDVGCGEGLFAFNLFEDKIDVGIEPNPKELERAASFDKYMELICCFGDKIPGNNKSFKTIFSNSVLEHIQDIKPVLTEMHRLLADDGQAYFTLPTDKFDQYTFGYQILSACGLKSLAVRYQNFFNKFWRHYHCYNKDNWELLFSQCGFKVKTQFEYASKAQCLLNDLGAPFCLFSFVVKKLTNNWFLFPGARKVITKFIYVPLFLSWATLKKQPQGKGGLIFFALEKI